MIADSWYMVSEYRLNLGPADTLEALVCYAYSISGLKPSEKREQIISFLSQSEDKELLRMKRFLEKAISDFMDDAKETIRGRQRENGISPRSISLKVFLQSYRKEDLRWYAKALQMRRYSSLSKDELAEKIANEMLLPSVMKKRRGILSDEQIQLFEAAMKPDFFPKDEQLDDADFLEKLDYAYFSLRDTLAVPYDVAAGYARINTPQFHERRKQKAWLLACLNVIPVFYCVAPVTVLHRMYRKKKGYRIEREELLELLSEIPDDLNPCICLGDELIAVNALQNEIYKKIQESQENKEFYIPTYDEVMDYVHNGYLSQEPTFMKLKHFFVKEMEMDENDAEDMIGEIWGRVNLGDNMIEIVEWLNERNLVFPSERSLNNFVTLYQNAHNNTRMLCNRGYKPIEMWQKEGSKMAGKTLTVVPGSTQAAKLLQESQEALNRMGVTVDYDSNADEIPALHFPSGIGGKAENAVRKIYPNDPCPCGSGKKYKKCCGRK